MRIRLVQFWNETRTSFWFVPALMVLAAIGFSFVTLAIDRNENSAFMSQLFLIWRGGPEGARGLLEVIAGSVLTVASLTFSLTLVTYSQASAQFGPRLLRNFIRDTGNQLVLGTYIATFVYCLLVLRAIRTSIEAGPDTFGVQEFVPYLSVSIGFLLCLISLGVLIYFIHHVSQSIYAPNVISAVAGELMRTIERMFPKEESELQAADAVEKPPALPEGFEQRAVPLEADHSGYLQGIDYEYLLGLAREKGLLLSITYRPGHFVIRGDDLARLWPPEQVDEHLARQLMQAFVIGRQRVAPQDVEFAIDQLVEVAVRALSPAINDPFTAMNCIDWLGVALSRLAEKKIPPPYYLDGEGAVRIFLDRPVTFQGVADAAFDQIRQQAGNHVAVLIRMLEVIAVIAEHTDDEKELQVLERQAQMVQRSSRKLVPESEDVKDIDKRFRIVERQTEAKD